MENPTVSIIVPVYNVKEYLPRCLDSLISQTLKSIEIIAIDDGATDESSFVLDSYASKDERIRVIHVSNGGVSKARNIGLDASKGDYIGFVDPDDYVDLNMLSTMVKVADEHKVDCVQCVFDIVKDHGELLEAGVSIGVKEYSLPDSVTALMRQEILHSVCVKVYRRSAISTIRFFESWKYVKKELLPGRGFISNK